MTEAQNRRPLKSRRSNWAIAGARWLARAGATPDVISASSAVFAAIGGGLLARSGLEHGELRITMLLAAACCIQLRLICNLLDGMVAVEHGRGGPYGPIWNELPDRFSDAFLLLGAGYGAQLAGAGYGAVLGWAATVGAMMTAYVRELGHGMGFPADFSGPMAKPHRMAILTAGCVMSCAEVEPIRGAMLTLALFFVTAGTAITLVLRAGRLARRLKARAQSECASDKTVARADISQAHH